MSRFDTDFLAASWPDLLDLVGVTVSYTPRGGSLVSASGIFDRDRTIPSYLPAEEQDVEYGVLRLSAAVAPNPQRGDTVTVEGQVWNVVAVGTRRPVAELQLERRVTGAIRDQASRL